ncbi:MAG: YfhO family protein [Saprospiraceae bacterium]
MSAKSIIKKGTPHIIAAIIFLMANAVYFSAQLQGKVENAHDTVSARANLQEIINHREATGDRTLWTNALFGGMPTYQIDGAQPSNLIRLVDGAAQLFIPRPIGLFFAAMLVFYIMLVLLGVNPWLSIVGALGFGFTTFNYVLFGAGHITKIRAIIYLSLVAAGVILAFRKKYLIGGLVFAVGFGLNLYANHIQMTYYFFMTLGIYGLIELAKHIKENELPSFGKAVLYLAIGGILAIGSSASKLWTTYEYGKDTMRGEPILVAESNAPATSSSTSGLEYGYATNWSNGWMDLVAGFIPGVVGGGGLTYWGANVDGTAGPAYYGAVIFFLFVFGSLIVQGPVKWWLASGVLLISLISMGKNLNFFYHFLFEYFPLFNKFRTPNSALTVVGVMMPILGMLALNDVLNGKVSKEKIISSLYISAGVLGALCLFYAVAGSSFFDFSYAKDAAYVQNYNVNIDAVKSQRSSMMSSDSWRSLGLILVAAGLIWLFVKEKINQTLLITGLALLVAGDLWSVDRGYLNNDNFVEKGAYRQQNAPRPVDSKILEDKDPNYRVFDVSRGISNAVNSSTPSYYHKNLGGYHPAKLQRYQDMLDRHILPEAQQLVGALQQAKTLGDVEGVLKNLTVFNMMNTKYIIANDNSPIPNSQAMGNAWFVDNFQTVNTSNEEIDGINGIDPKQTAIVNKEFSDYLSGLNIQKNGTIQLTSYEPNHLTYTSNSTSEQLAVFSEVWYGPNKGWQAYVDGKPVDHIRVNYIMRAMKVPAGQHDIEFKFEPKSFRIGETVSLICSLIIVLGLLAFVGKLLFEKYQEPDAVETTSKDPVAKTKSKKKKK